MTGPGERGGGPREGVRPARPGEDGFHAVSVEKIENGRVYWRNPWGPAQEANGTAMQYPPRRIENNATGLESMNLDEFKERVTEILLPA